MAEKEGSLAPVDYLEGHEYGIQLIRWMLKTISAWPMPSVISLPEKIFSEVVMLVCSFLILSAIIPATLSMIYEEAENIVLTMVKISTICYWVLATFKYLVLLFHVNDIRRCLDHMETDWRTVTTDKDRNVMLNSAKISRYIAGFSALLMYSGVFSYHILRILSPGVPMGNDSVAARTLPNVFYDKIWDTRFSPAYETVCVIQSFSAFVFNTITVGSCSLSAAFVMHARSQIRILVGWIYNIVDGDVEERTTVQQRLVFIVESHLRIISFASDIEEIIHPICFVEILASTITICIVGYIGITEWNLNERQNIPAYIAILVSLCFNLFVYCYIGEILTEESKEIGQTVYMTEWYRLPQKTAGDLILIILRSSSVIKISAGKIVALSLSTFGNVLKTSLTYFNMICAVTNNDET